MNVPMLLAGRLRSMAMPIAIIAILGLTVTFLVVPLRTWIAQRDMVEIRSGQYAAYEEVNDALQDEIDALRTPEGVRQAVREQLGYLLPNERRVPLLEMPNASVTLPARWPYTLVASIVSLRETQRSGVEQGNLDTYDPTRP
ncbi:MAG: FtsB family cell division protein [Ilumatobacteraceae bacterium]